MSARKARRQPKATATDPPSLAERVGAERERVFNATSIIACCRLACASKFVYHPEVMTDALQAAHDILDEAAGELQVIRDQHRKKGVARWEAQS